MGTAATPTADTFRAPSAVSLGYITTYWIPLVVIVSAVVGTRSGYPNLAAYFPLVIAYLIIPVINRINPRIAMSEVDRERLSAGWQGFYRAVILCGFPAQMAMYAVAASHFQADVLNPWGRLGVALSTGVFGALFAVNIGHELIHRKERLERLMGNVLLSTVSFGMFKVNHLRIHHRYVATPLDPSTASRGTGLYAFLWRAITEGFARSLSIEKAQLSKRGKQLWQGELAFSYGLSLVWLGVSITVWGAMGGLFFVLQSLVAIIKLELFNYLQHYGLTRRMKANGKFEAVRTCHSWSQDAQVTNRLLLNLTLHGDHHANPERRYERLRIADGSPRYPYDTSIMSLLALVPPWFRRVVHPHLDALEERPKPARCPGETASW